MGVFGLDKALSWIKKGDTFFNPPAPHQMSDSFHHGAKTTERFTPDFSKYSDTPRCSVFITKKQWGSLKDFWQNGNRDERGKVLKNIYSYIIKKKIYTLAEFENLTKRLTPEEAKDIMTNFDPKDGILKSLGSSLLKMLKSSLLSIDVRERDLLSGWFYAKTLDSRKEKEEVQEIKKANTINDLFEDNQIFTGTFELCNFSNVSTNVGLTMGSGNCSFQLENPEEILIINERDILEGIIAVQNFKTQKKTLVELSTKELKDLLKDAPPNEGEIFYYEARRYFEGKAIFEPMDKVYIWMSVPQFYEPYYQNILNNKDVGLLLERKKTEFTEELANELGFNDVVQMRTVLRMQPYIKHLEDNDGMMQVFEGLISKVAASYDANSGKHVLSVEVVDNSKYLTMSRIMKEPAARDPKGFLNNPFRENEKTKETYWASEELHVQGDTFWADQNQDETSSGDINKIVTTYKDAVNKYGLVPFTDPYALIDAANLISFTITGVPYNLDIFIKNTAQGKRLLPKYNNDGSREEIKPFFEQLREEVQSQNKWLGNFEPFLFGEKLNTNEFEDVIEETDFETSKSMAALEALVNFFNNENDQDKKVDEILKDRGSQKLNGIRIIESYKSTKLKEEKEDFEQNTTLEEGYDYVKKQNSSSGIFTQKNIKAKDFVSEATTLGIYLQAGLDERTRRKELLKEWQAKSLGEQKDKFFPDKLIYPDMREIKNVGKKNFLIISDSYSRNDIQAYAGNIKGSFGLWQSDYDNPMTICQEAANQLHFEFYVDENGHIRFTPPRFNRTLEEHFDLIPDPQFITKEENKKYFFPEQIKKAQTFLDKFKSTRAFKLLTETRKLLKLIQEEKNDLETRDKQGDLLSPKERVRLIKAEKQITLLKQEEKEIERKIKKQDFENSFYTNPAHIHILDDIEIISWALSENEPDFCRLDIQGTPQWVDLKEGAETYYWAGGVDYYLWRNYGYREGPSITKGFIHSGADAIPICNALLSEQRNKIFSGTITVRGSAKYKVGDTVYIKSRMMYYYITNVSNSFTYGSTYVTTLTLGYGRIVGTYIPHIWDEIGQEKLPFDVISSNRFVILDAGEVTLYYDSNKYKIEKVQKTKKGEIASPNYTKIKDLLENTIAIIKPKNKWNIYIEGHTDSAGDSKFNLDLSKKRATQVKETIEEIFKTEKTFESYSISNVEFNIEYFGEQFANQKETFSPDRKVEIVISKIEGE